ncbi:MAG: Lrp/AsnC family transcriptional regulator [Nitrososphaera sp.]|nr:Lrp/AsnC family transcriptional regulator [Nitrososphaera sp.]
MKEGAVEALEKALIFTIDAYSHSGLVRDDEIIKKLQETLLHFKRKTLSAPNLTTGIEAYVMLNCDLGLEDTIIRELLVMPEVSEVKGVFGVYDIIVKISADSEQNIKRVIEKIRAMPLIKSSLTMMVIEGQGSKIIGP